tara:strand:+ start:177 stop:386 length:210 start_codon:yes stop_codon:yes gene_type:complete
MYIIDFIIKMLYDEKERNPDEIFASQCIEYYISNLKELKKKKELNENDLLKKKRLEISIIAINNHYNLE